MIPLDTEQLSVLSAEYTRKGYAILPRLVDSEVAAEWEVRHRPLPGKKVHVGRDYHATWVEQKFSDPSLALDGFAFADGFIHFITTIAGLDAIDRNRTEVWINRYSPGDRIPYHCDRAGSTQLVLCLQGLLEPEKGGDLIVRDEPVALATGDAVLFLARRVPHGTLPIGTPKVGSSGFARVTCVIRLFASNDTEGASS
jgi:hypothetical protein